MRLNNAPKFDKRQISGVINIKLDGKTAKDTDTLHILSAMRDFLGYGFKYCDKILLLANADERREKITFGVNNKSDFDMLLQEGILTRNMFKKIDRISAKTIQESGFSFTVNAFNVDLEKHIINVNDIKFEHKKDEPLENLKMTILENTSIKDADFFTLYDEVLYIYYDFISREECLSYCLDAYFKDVETIEEFDDVENAIMDSKDNVKEDARFTNELDVLQNKIDEQRERLGFSEPSLD